MKKKLTKVLATFTLKSSLVLIALLATTVLVVQSCRKADVNATTTEAAFTKEDA